MAYNGSAFKIVNNKTIGYIAGSALILWNLENNKKDYIWSEREGFQYFSVNHKRGIICAVEYGLNPNINVYFYPKLHPALQLKGTFLFIKKINHLFRTYSVGSIRY